MTHRFLLFAARITGWVLVGVLAGLLLAVLVVGLIVIVRGAVS